MISSSQKCLLRESTYSKVLCSSSSSSSISTISANDINEGTSSHQTIDYKENLNSIVNLKQFDEIITNTLLDTTVDKFSLLSVNGDGTNLKSFQEKISKLRHIDSVVSLVAEESSLNINSNNNNINNQNESILTVKNDQYIDTSALLANKIVQQQHLDESIKLKGVINDDIQTKLKLIERDIMPNWCDIDKNEQKSIHTILTRWQGIINSKFNVIKSKNKFIKEFELKESKYSRKGKFNYEHNRIQMDKLQLGLFQICSGLKKPNSKADKIAKTTINTQTPLVLTSSEINDKLKIKPNTRLILRSFKKFMDSFYCLENTEICNSNGDMKQYWLNLNKFLKHLSKGVLRSALYIYENAQLNKCSLGSPPLYVIESDCCDGDYDDIPYVEFETLYEYVYLCICQLDKENKQERRKYGLNVNSFEHEDVQDFDYDKEISNVKNSIKGKLSNKRLILRLYVLMLNCLVRVVQLALVIREYLTFKSSNYQIDTFSHILAHECNLLREYLKEILKLDSNHNNC